MGLSISRRRSSPNNRIHPSDQYLLAKTRVTLSNHSHHLMNILTKYSFYAMVSKPLMMEIQQYDISLMQEALKQCMGSLTQEQILDIHVLLSHKAHRCGMLSVAYDAYRNALAFLEFPKDEWERHLQAFFSMGMAEILIECCYYDEAMHLAQKALFMVEKDGWMFLRCLMLRGMIHMHAGNTEQATEDFLSVVECSAEQGVPLLLASVYLALLPTASQEEKTKSHLNLRLALRQLLNHNEMVSFLDEDIKNSHVPSVSELSSHISDTLHQTFSSLICRIMTHLWRESHENESAIIFLDKLSSFTHISCYQQLETLSTKLELTLKCSHNSSDSERLIQHHMDKLLSTLSFMCGSLSDPLAARALFNQFMTNLFPKLRKFVASSSLSNKYNLILEYEEFVRCLSLKRSISLEYAEIGSFDKLSSPQYLHLNPLSLPAPLNIGQMKDIASNYESTIIFFSINNGRVESWKIQSSSCSHYSHVDEKRLEAIILDWESFSASNTSSLQACNLGDLRRFLCKMHDMLIPSSIETERLIICPVGVLWRVPFSALLSEGVYLNEKCSISFIPYVEMLLRPTKDFIGESAQVSVPLWVTSSESHNSSKRPDSVGSIGKSFGESIHTFRIPSPAVVKSILHGNSKPTERSIIHIEDEVSTRRGFNNTLHSHWLMHPDITAAKIESMATGNIRANLIHANRQWSPMHEALLLHTPRVLMSGSLPPKVVEEFYKTVMLEQESCRESFSWDSALRDVVLRNFRLGSISFIEMGNAKIVGTIF